jgi:hypothetical protein
MTPSDAQDAARWRWLAQHVTFFPQFLPTLSAFRITGLPEREAGVFTQIVDAAMHTEEPVR